VVETEACLVTEVLAIEVVTGAAFKDEDDVLEGIVEVEEATLAIF
jgi:hypothetical protein